MLASSLEDKEECPICMTEMEVGKALRCVLHRHVSVCFLKCVRDPSSFSCEHTFCKTCTSKLAPGYADSVVCPSCRKDIPKDDMEVVEYTASEQWDALLEVANRWATIDDVLDGESEDDDSGDENAEDDEGDDDVKKEDTEVSNHKDGRRCVRCL